MFEKWKKELTDVEKEILQSTYTYWKENKEWPYTIELAVKIRKKGDLFQIIEKLGRQFIRVGHPSHKGDRIELSLYGIALCQNTSEEIELFMKVLRICAQKYVENPLEAEVTYEDFVNDPDFKDVDSDIISYFIYESRIWSGASSRESKEFRFQLEYSTLRYEDIQNIDEYYNKRQMGRIPSRFGGPEETGYQLSSVNIDASELYPQNNINIEISPYSSLDIDFIKDEKIRDIVESDLKELHYVLQVEGWKSVTILSASIAESILMVLLHKNEEIARRTLKGKWPNRVTLYDMINAASKSGLISEPEKAIFEILRTYRNLIHPEKASWEKRPGKYVAFALASLVHKLINDANEEEEKRQELAKEI